MITKMEATSSWPGHTEKLTYPADDLGFVPANWIRGFDVVGEESEARYEAYAPMLRWLRADRKGPDSSEDMLEGRSGSVRRRFLSIHAGEDYGYPLSGMRHGDETVLFCKMAGGRARPRSTRAKRNMRSAGSSRATTVSQFLRT